MTRIGVQTRPWGPEANRQRLDNVLADIAQAGYAGFEIGSQHLDLARPDWLQSLAATHGLAVAAVHTGGDLNEPGWAHAHQDDVRRVAAYAAAVGAPFVPFSGRPKPGKTDADLRAQAETLNAAGQVCAGEGVRLCYHNHNWEIEDGCRELYSLVDLTDPALVSFCLDVAWVHRGGAQPVEVARRLGGRIGYFHLKDTAGAEWLELGQGDVDLAGVLALLRERQDPWAVVEQDETRRAPAESARMSRDYLKAHGF